MHVSRKEVQNNNVKTLPYASYFGVPVMP